MPFDQYITSHVQAHQADFYLQQSFPFYQQLNTENKTRFIYRLCAFVRLKKFVPRQGLVFTEEMATLTCACAIQLTFGLEYYTIDYFDTILLYPDIYVSPHTEKKHHGEVNLGGFVCFSWASLKSGIAKNNNFNVGLHEWAHALRFNGFRGHDGDAFFDTYFQKWLMVNNSLYNDIRKGKNTYINKYGGSNLGEFFPVMMEHFFENPKYIRDHHPQEYESTCLLLNIDPTNEMNPTADVRRRIFSAYTFKDSRVIYMESHHGKGYIIYMLPMIGVFMMGLLAFKVSLFCTCFIFLLGLIPFVLFFAGKHKRVQMTENGLLRGSKSLNPFDQQTKKYCWQQVIKADFGEPTSAGGAVHTYPYIHFTVWNGAEFKELKFHQSLDQYQAENMKKKLHEKKVAVLKRNFRNHYSGEDDNFL